MGLDYLHANNICHGGNFLLRVPSFDGLSMAELYEHYDLKILILDYGTSFIISKTLSPKLYMPALYAPPEELFNDYIIGTIADVWTLGVILYNAMGKRPLFETFIYNLDDIISEMVNTLGH
ncbi:protein kinase domain-containing protein [Trichophyton equinum CBS 127.97]|uniref:Protein kinase domain-containing protein n=1 Tax=Trichophyton equinum (strain ATCC MYA-4606 / CBS 127.97) TaxID=559882 RepID=F2Q4I1_TRIEC|nr:protein kinase domain-containing protein [Trichophyton equinum CBS 127.97]